MQGIHAIDAEMIELCRQLHAYPELSLRSSKPQIWLLLSRVVGDLKCIVVFWGSSVVGRLQQSCGSKVIGIQADMDVLPILG